MHIAGWILLAFLSLPVIEIYLLIKLIGALGFIPTLALLLSAGAVGMFLLRTQGLGAWLKLQQGLARGELPAREMIESGLLALGGLLLLIPGFLSDALALVCLIPGSRRRLAAYFLDHHLPRPRGDGPASAPTTIEGEFRRED